MRKLKVFIAMSLDGYLAAPGDDLSFLDQLPQTGEDHGYQAFIQDIDTVVMGRKTYSKLLNMEVAVPHEGCKHYVFTRNSNLKSGIMEVEYITSDPVSWMIKEKEGTGKSIYCDGGASLLRSFWEADLVDEWIVSVIPVILGKGIRLFEQTEGDFAPKWLQPTSVKQYQSGLIQLNYLR